MQARQSRERYLNANPDSFCPRIFLFTSTTRYASVPQQPRRAFCVPGLLTGEGSSGKDCPDSCLFPFRNTFNLLPPSPVAGAAHLPAAHGSMKSTTYTLFGAEKMLNSISLINIHTLGGRGRGWWYRPRHARNWLDISRRNCRRRRRNRQQSPARDQNELENANFSGQSK